MTDLYANLKGTSPLVIGGTGGSGTRLIALMCRYAGYHLGQQLNDSLDALNFYDFHDRWLSRYLSRTLDEKMQTTLRQELSAIIDKLYNETPMEQRQRWGWKTPRSLLFLPLLDHCVQDLHFIQVVRDGRDMAYSGNQNQLHKHGSELLDESQRSYPEYLQSLLFWQITNLRAAEYGVTRMCGRYLWLRYEDIVTDNVTTINALANFLQIADPRQLQYHNTIHTSLTIGRWRQRSVTEQQLLTTLGKEGLQFFGYC